MKKYYVWPDASSDYDFTVYYDEDVADREHFFCGGRMGYIDLNKDMVEDIDDKLSNINDGLQDLNEDEVLKVNKLQMREAVYELVRYYFKDITEPRKVLELLKQVKAWTGAQSFDKYECYAAVLSLIYDEPFTSGSISGSSQSDWLYYVCPESFKASGHLKWIEAVLFGLGIELKITNEMYDSLEEAEEAEDYYYDFTDATSDQRIKEYVAKQMPCRPDEVELIN